MPPADEEYTLDDLSTASASSRSKQLGDWIRIQQLLASAKAHEGVVEDRQQRNQLSAQKVQADQLKTMFSERKAARAAYMEILKNQQAQARKSAQEVYKMIQQGAKTDPKLMAKMKNYAVTLSFAMNVAPAMIKLGHEMTDEDMDRFVEGKLDPKMDAKSRSILKQEVQPILKHIMQSPDEGMKGLHNEFQHTSAYLTGMDHFAKTGNADQAATATYQSLLSQIPQYDPKAEATFVRQYMQQYGGDVGAEGGGSTKTAAKAPTDISNSPVAGYIKVGNRTYAIPKAGASSGDAASIGEYNDTKPNLNVDPSMEGGRNKVARAVQDWYEKTHGGGLTKADKKSESTPPVKPVGTSRSPASQEERGEDQPIVGRTSGRIQIPLPGSGASVTFDGKPIADFIAGALKKSPKGTSKPTATSPMQTAIDNGPDSPAGRARKTGAAPEPSPTPSATPTTPQQPAEDVDWFRGIREYFKGF